MQKPLAFWAVFTYATVATVLLADVREFGDATEINQRLGLGQSELHRRNQTMAAAENFGIVGCGKSAHRIGKRCGTEIGERCGDHLVFLSVVCMADQSFS